MSSSLKNNLKEERESLELFLKILDDDIMKVDLSIEQKSKLKNIPQYGIDRLTVYY